MKKLTVDSQKLIFYDMQLNQLIKTRIEESLVGRRFSFLCACSIFQFEKFIIKKTQIDFRPLWLWCGVGSLLTFDIFHKFDYFHRGKNSLTLIVSGGGGSDFFWKNFTHLKRKDKRGKDREEVKILIFIHFL